MDRARRSWVRGAVVLGLAGTMMAAALMSPALAVRLATTGFVKQKVRAAVNQVTTNLTAQINAANTASRQQTYLRSNSVTVPAGSAAAGEVTCPGGMIVTGGGAAVSNGALVLNDSVPTDGSGTFTSSFGLTGGVGMTGWGAIVTDTGSGGGTFRVYAICRTGTQTGSNYTAGNTAPRVGVGGTSFRNG